MTISRDGGGERWKVEVGIIFVLTSKSREGRCKSKGKREEEEGFSKMVVP